MGGNTMPNFKPILLQLNISKKYFHLLNILVHNIHLAYVLCTVVEEGG